jgi:hypothetical protein
VMNRIINYLQQLMIDKNKYINMEGTQREFDSVQWLREANLVNGEHLVMWRMQDCHTDTPPLEVKLPVLITHRRDVLITLC